MKVSVPIHQLKRRARLLSRAENIALNVALDRIARDEGFAAWSLLSARHAAGALEDEMLAQLSPGDLVLLAARPRHGKTLRGLRLLLDAVRDGRAGVLFTLEYTEQDARRRLRLLEKRPGLSDALDIATSDDISADFIVRHLGDAARGTVAVVDYLQILDQRRDKPELSVQIDALAGFARASGVILVFIAQIDRTYDADMKAIPDMSDLRLPNHLDTGLFSKAWFLQNGAARVQTLA